MIRGGAGAGRIGMQRPVDRCPEMEQRVPATYVLAVNSTHLIALTNVFSALECVAMNPLKPNASTSTNICLLFRQVRDGLAHLIEEDLAKNGYPFNLSQFLVLRKLDVLGPMSAIDLSRAIDHNPGAMTRLLDRLEQLGYLRRTPQAGDRRALRIELTEAGAALSQQLNSSADRVADHALRTLSPAERELFVGLLERVHGSL